MNNKAIICLCLFCFCAANNVSNKPKNYEISGNNSYPKKSEIINLDQNCKNKIEEMLIQEFNKKYKYFVSMRIIGSDTITAFYQDLESKEIRDNSIWIYLDNQCNILGKKTGTIYNPKK